jgi:hypothetical protein
LHAEDAKVPSFNFFNIAKAQGSSAGSMGPFLPVKASLLAVHADYREELVIEIGGKGHAFTESRGIHHRILL